MIIYSKHVIVMWMLTLGYSNATKFFDAAVISPWARFVSSGAGITLFCHTTISIENTVVFGLLKSVPLAEHVGLTTLDTIFKMSWFKQARYDKMSLTLFWFMTLSGRAPVRDGGFVKVGIDSKQCAYMLCPLMQLGHSAVFGCPESVQLA